MRPALGLVAVAVLGVLTAFALPHAGRAANPKLFGTVGPGYTITLKDSGGNDVTSIPAGTYDIEISDASSLHNFDLEQPGGASVDSTDISGTGTVTWTNVALTPGTWTYVCDAHAFMTGSFTVTGGPATSSGSASVPTATSTTTPTGSTALPPTTPTLPTTTASAPGRVRCRVPSVVGTQLSAARRALGRRHCRTGRVSRRYSPRKRWRVLEQRPRAGVLRPSGTAVSLVVSRGPR